jgi:hypothetical protein
LVFSELDSSSLLQFETLLKTHLKSDTHIQTLKMIVDSMIAYLMEYQMHSKNMELLKMMAALNSVASIRPLLCAEHIPLIYPLVALAVIDY